MQRGAGFLEDILASIAAAIPARLTAVPYQQLSTPTTDTDCLEPWHESPILLDPAYLPPEGLSHLAFSVLAISAPNSNLDRDEETMTPGSQVEVRFCYRLRGPSSAPSDQVEDHRLAIRAAREIVALVNSESWRADADACRVLITNRWRPIAFEQQYQIVSVDFLIYHEEPLTFTERV